MVDITVSVPNGREPEFYRRFADFLEGPETPAPPMITLGIDDPPAWTLEDDAQQHADELWSKLSDPARELLRVLISRALQGDAAQAPVKSSASSLVEATNLGGKQAVAGVLGGVGKVIARLGLPKYLTPSGAPWHFVWGWSGELYWMSPRMAELLASADQRALSARRLDRSEVGISRMNTEAHSLRSRSSSAALREGGHVNHKGQTPAARP